MVQLYEVEMEPEVSSWLVGLTDRHHAAVDFAVGMLAERPTTRGEPYSRHLGGKTRELRFGLGTQAHRISYWVAPGKRVVLLTHWRKTRMKETGEVNRAIAAQEECEARHTGEATHKYSRTTKKGE
ncbi:type II toxin-antitoxin system RelE/ParE family toxin [Streptomyces hydrogenans]|uniref:type II toxin-antitoxin system RelE/ParE family toxin n=1 Tax=Streptomyces hydrogenans TaxID=1873719 RepID=UPI00362BB20E